MHETEHMLERTVAAARGIPAGELDRLGRLAGWRHTMRWLWQRLRVVRQRHGD